MSNAGWRRKVLTSMFNEQAGICPYCMEEMTLERDQHNSATIEHILPKSRGGPDVRDNFMAVCMCCNQERGNTPLGPHLIAVRSRHPLRGFK